MPSEAVLLSAHRSPSGVPLATLASDDLVPLDMAPLLALLDADPRSVAQQLWSACHGAVALEISGICVVDDMEQNYEALLETLLRGISAPPVPTAATLGGGIRRRLR